MKKLTKSILFYVAILVIVYVIFKFGLEFNNYIFLKWIDTTVMFISIIGIILGTIQMICHSTKTSKWKVLIATCVCTFEILLATTGAWAYFKFSPREELVDRDNKKMIKITHYELLSNDIEYYDYINNFIRNKTARIIEDYSDAIGTKYYRGTIFNDENGELFEEYDSEGKLIYKKDGIPKEKKSDEINNNDTEQVQSVIPGNIIYKKEFDRTIIEVNVIDVAMTECGIEIKKSTDGGEKWESHIPVVEDPKEEVLVTHLDAGYGFINENTGFINDYIKNEDLSVEEQKNRHMYVTNDGGKTFKIATINVLEEVTGILYIGAESMPYIENNILKMKINSYSIKNGEKNQYEFQSIDNGLTWNFCEKL